MKKLIIPVILCAALCANIGQPADAGLFTAYKVRVEKNRIYSDAQKEIKELFDRQTDMTNKYDYEGLLLIRSELHTLWKLMPFAYTAAAAAGRCVLCSKYRMSFRRSLLTVIWNFSRSDTFCNKIPCMQLYCFKSFFFKIKPVFFFQLKTASKLRFSQMFKKFVKHLHTLSYSANQGRQS